jgi:hypothetical protein
MSIGVAVAVALGQFENPGRMMSAVESQYQRTGEGEQTEKPNSCIVNCRL